MKIDEVENLITTAVSQNDPKKIYSLKDSDIPADLFGDSEISDQVKQLIKSKSQSDWVRFKQMIDSAETASGNSHQVPATFGMGEAIVETGKLMIGAGKLSPNTLRLKADWEDAKEKLKHNKNMLKDAGKYDEEKEKVDDLQQKFLESAAKENSQYGVKLQQLNNRRRVQKAFKASDTEDMETIEEDMEEVQNSSFSNLREPVSTLLVHLGQTKIKNIPKTMEYIAAFCGQEFTDEIQDLMVFPNMLESSLSKLYQNLHSTATATECPLASTLNQILQNMQNPDAVNSIAEQFLTAYDNATVNDCKIVAKSFTDLPFQIDDLAEILRTGVYQPEMSPIGEKSEGDIILAEGGQVFDKMSDDGQNSSGAMFSSMVDYATGKPGRFVTIPNSICGMSFGGGYGFSLNSLDELKDGVKFTISNNPQFEGKTLTVISKKDNSTFVISDGNEEGELKLEPSDFANITIQK